MRDGGRFDAFEEADEEDVGRKLLHFGLHENAAFRAAQFVALGNDLVQAATTKGVLTRQHSRRVVQTLQAHGALQHRIQHLPVHGLFRRLGSLSRNEPMSCRRIYVVRV